MERNIYLIDPLPRIADSVKKAIESASSEDLKIKYVAKPESIESLLASIELSLKKGLDLAFVMPVNELKGRPVYDSFCAMRNCENESVFDLLGYILSEIKESHPNTVIPVIMPYLFEFKGDNLRLEIKKREDLTHVLCSAAGHINGTIKKYKFKTVAKAFRKHLRTPEKDNFILDDFVEANGLEQ